MTVLHKKEESDNLHDKTLEKSGTKLDREEILLNDLAAWEKL